jgi:alkanesulfonate monooxygenase SsuD/methylene tetrahydromethanopterin reductase-like flavin-dependent oxidoreductase (luciferase family)
MMLAVIGGAHERFLPFVELFHRATAELGTGPDGGRLPVGVHSPGFVAETDEQARELLYPHFAVNRDRIGRERGWPPVTRDRFEAEIEHGALNVGSPETVAHKIARTLQALGAARFDMKYSSGTLGHDQMMRSIELYGTRVIPMVRELLA